MLSNFAIRLQKIFFYICNSMRWIITILTFYMLALSVVPCYDAGNECNDNRRETISAQSHDHKQDKDDVCTPFCTCNCCHSSIVSFNFKPFEFNQVKPAVMVQKITVRDFYLFSNYYGTIWQPPKSVINC